MSMIALSSWDATYPQSQSACFLRTLEERSFSLLVLEFLNRPGCQIFESSYSEFMPDSMPLFTASSQISRPPRATNGRVESRSLLGKPLFYLVGGTGIE